MPRSWSNMKLPPPPSPAERARLGRPSSATAFLVLLGLMIVFCLGITFYSTYYAEKHPPTAAYQPAADQPKDH